MLRDITKSYSDDSWEETSFFPHDYTLKNNDHQAYCCCLDMVCDMMNRTPYHRLDDVSRYSDDDACCNDDERICFCFSCALFHHLSCFHDCLLRFHIFSRFLHDDAVCDDILLDHESSWSSFVSKMVYEFPYDFLTCFSF